MTMDIADYLTPCRRPEPLLAPSGKPGSYNSHGVDCPFVFRHRGRFFMLHIGFDGAGYQTALAVSDDLLHWSHYANILGRDDGGRWDSGNAAGVWMILKDSRLEGVPELRRIDGRYWLLYHSYPGAGYEQGAAEMSFATCRDEELLHWERLPKPVFSWRNGAAWERGGLYKGAVVEWNSRYYMLYNAKDRTEWPWLEQTGIAVSDDLLHWERPLGEPVLKVRPGEWDSTFVSDPYPVQDRGRWLDFFFGHGPDNASEGLAWSDDLLHWERHPEPILRHGAPGSHDEIHAHKACVFRHEGVLYHFYCGVRRIRPGDAVAALGHHEFRAIYVATDSGRPEGPASQAARK